MYIRDAEGCFVLANTTWFSPLCSVEIGEALGLFNTWQWLANLGFDNMDFSLDSKVVVDAINNNHSYNNELDVII